MSSHPLRHSISLTPHSVSTSSLITHHMLLTCCPTHLQCLALSQSPPSCSQPGQILTSHPQGVLILLWISIPNSIEESLPQARLLPQAKMGLRFSFENMHLQPFGDKPITACSCLSSSHIMITYQ